MGIEKDVILVVLGSGIVAAGSVVCTRTPKQKIEWPTDPEDFRSFADNHCTKKLSQDYPGITVPQKTYEGCIDEMVKQLTSPFDRFSYDHKEEIMGSIFVSIGVILALLPAIIRGRARFGFR